MLEITQAYYSTDRPKDYSTQMLFKIPPLEQMQSDGASDVTADSCRDMSVVQLCPQLN